MVSVCDRICMDVGKCRYQLGIGSVFPALRPVQIPSRYRADTDKDCRGMGDSKIIWEIKSNHLEDVSR